MRLLLVKAFKPRMNSNWGDFHQHLTVRNWYGTPRESGEAIYARHSERPQKGRRR
nr:hypothetical protein [Tanacetum cinerariifolium]